MEDNNKYNGWSNYATWRVKLELVDSVNYEEEECGIKYTDVKELAETIKNNTEQYLEDEASGGNGNQSIAYQYAMAFLDDVNWEEIAEGVLEDINNK